VSVALSAPRGYPVAFACGLLVLALLAPGRSSADELNGFDLSDVSVKRELIRAGTKRDGIKAVDQPVFVSLAETRVVAQSTPVIGIAVAGDARAYPVHLLEYHQIVNDTVGGRPVVVTYDPLAGTPLVFGAVVGGVHLHFSVSGLVYESNFLLYDRETNSLWSQFLGQAIAGPQKGTRLERIRTRQEAFAAWAQREPKTTVLERPFPKRIDYRYSPFSDYWISETVPFPVSSKDDRFHPKDGVLGVEVGGKTRAYLGSVLPTVGGRIVDKIAGRKIRIAYDGEASAFSWEAPDDVRVTDAYWFSWRAFHPDTEVWSADGAAGSVAPPEAE
jgi:hypothetical protein